MATNKTNDGDNKPVEKSPEQIIADLTAKLKAEEAAKQAALDEKAVFENLLEEANKKVQAAGVPTLEIEGETYKINVPKVTYKDEIVDITSLPEEALKGFIGEALELIN